MKTFIIKRGLFDTRSRTLNIDPEFIKFENKDRIDDLFTIIKKEDIAGLRYGIHFIKGYNFYIGREYQIFLRDKQGKELKICFKLFYGRNLQQKHKLFNDIIDVLWDSYFDEICTNYKSMILNNEPFRIGNVIFSENKIKFNKKEILSSDLEIKKYNHYFVICSAKDPYLNLMLNHLADQDAVIIYHLITTIIQNEQNRKKEISDRTV